MDGAGSGAEGHVPRGLRVETGAGAAAGAGAVNPEATFEGDAVRNAADRAREQGADQESGRGVHGMARSGYATGLRVATDVATIGASARTADTRSKP